MRGVRITAFAACALWVAFASVARAQEAAVDGASHADASTTSSTSASTAAPAAAATTAPARPVPVDPYARTPGAPPPRADVARGWRIAPRKKFRPAVKWVRKKTGRGARFVLDTAFIPFRGAINLNERYAIVRRVEGVLYNDARTAAALPLIKFTSGFGVMVGARAFHKDVLGDDERLELKYQYGDLDRQAAELSFTLPKLVSGRFYVDTIARFERADNLLFMGIGHAPPEGAVDTRFFQRRFLGSLSAGVRFGGPYPKTVAVGGSLIVNRRQFEDRTLGDVYDPTNLVGFGERVVTGEVTLDLRIDTRDSVGKTASGLLVDAFFGGVPDVDRREFLHYGLEAAYHQTLLLPGRLAVVRVAIEGVYGDDDRIPFTDLPRIGGRDLLRGYPRDRFRDRIAAVGTLEYRYPIHHYVSGHLFVDTGKVARTYDRLFGSGLGDDWQVGVGGGFLIHTLEDLKLAFDVSYGDGFQIMLSTDALAAFDDRRKEL